MDTSPQRHSFIVIVDLASFRSDLKKTSCTWTGRTADSSSSRREFVLKSVNFGFFASIFTWGAAPRPEKLGVQTYGSTGIRTLGICPPTPNCVSTADETDISHYIPSWNYNPTGRRNVTQADAMQELVDVVKTLKPDNFTPTIINQTDDYLYVEYQSPTFGFIDDTEFWFGGKDIVEYRSASRIGESDGDINRKRIRAIRKALETKGWRSIGFS
ncbi:hypothetical protein WJX72_000105 [[Myrmecia] bisecta]|uniref:DUF1499 domain-containing protein n=1 Tax=[Myrmecia] bisecta TaxID=41462 RepID=A0AAW1PFH2_9CHLO